MLYIGLATLITARQRLLWSLLGCWTVLLISPVGCIAQIEKITVTSGGSASLAAGYTKRVYVKRGNEFVSDVAFSTETFPRNSHTIKKDGRQISAKAVELLLEAAQNSAHVSSTDYALLGITPETVKKQSSLRLAEPDSKNLTEHHRILKAYLLETSYEDVVDEMEENYHSMELNLGAYKKGRRTFPRIVFGNLHQWYQIEIFGKPYVSLRTIGTLPWHVNYDKREWDSFDPALNHVTFNFFDSPPFKPGEGMLNNRKDSEWWRNIDKRTVRRNLDKILSGALPKVPELYPIGAQFSRFWVPQLYVHYQNLNRSTPVDRVIYMVNFKDGKTITDSTELAAQWKNCLSCTKDITWLKQWKGERSDRSIVAFLGTPAWLQKNKKDFSGYEPAVSYPEFLRSDWQDLKLDGEPQCVIGLASNRTRIALVAVSSTDADRLMFKLDKKAYPEDLPWLPNYNWKVGRKAEIPDAIKDLIPALEKPPFDAPLVIIPMPITTYNEKSSPSRESN